MKKLYIFGFLLLATGINEGIVEDKTPQLLMEQQKAFATKIAWFDFDEVFAKSFEYKDELDRVERAVKEKEGEFIKLKKEHDEAVAKLQNAGSTMKDDARERTIERIGELRQKIDIKRSSLDQYLQRERVGIQSKMMEKIYEAAATIAEAEGWDAVNPLIPKKTRF